MNYLDQLELFFLCALLLWNWKLQSAINSNNDTLTDLINGMKSEFKHKVDYQEIQTKSKMDELQMKCDKIFLENQLEAQRLRNKWESIVLELNRNKMEKKLNDILLERKEKKKATQENKVSEENIAIKEPQEKPTTQKRKVGRPRKVQEENFTFGDAITKLESWSKDKKNNKPIRFYKGKSLIVHEVNMALKEKYGNKLSTYIKRNNKEYRAEYRSLYKHFWQELKKKGDMSNFKSKISINESEKPLFIPF